MFCQGLHTILAHLKASLSIGHHSMHVPQESHVWHTDGLPWWVASPQNLALWEKYIIKRIATLMLTKADASDAPTPINDYNVAQSGGVIVSEAQKVRTLLNMYHRCGLYGVDHPHLHACGVKD